MENDISTAAQAAPQAAPGMGERPARRVGLFWPIALLTFVALVLLAGWLAITGKLDFLIPSLRGDAAPAAVASAPAVPAPVMAAPDAAQAQQAQAQAQASMLVGGVETRLALLEERLSRIDQQAHAASGNAARAEGLLIAFAARRVIARGAQLGYLENQLRLRFGGAQPDAVATVIAFGKEPVTVDQLVSGLDALTPALANSPKGENGWDWLRRELSGLFVVRGASTQAANPSDRIARARLMMMAGKTSEAIDEVSKLPGADRASAWIAGARRYMAAQQALDVIETAAMLEPRLLHDGEGAPVMQTSPLSPPADAAASASAAPAPGIYIPGA
ncbi:MAG: MICOS complex subunit MIC60 [Novosphingobium sp.]|nr:MICOS complex subunit MIC60 [Novosphingobium sp.]